MGIVWIAAAAVLWSRRRDRRSALPVALFALLWLLGSIVPALVFAHRGALVHLLLAQPRGRLASRRAQVAVAAVYAEALASAQWGSAEQTLLLALVLIAAAAWRTLSATGIVRRSRAVAGGLVAAAGLVLGAGAVTRLAGSSADVLPLYQAVLAIGAVVLVADLRAARWARGTIADLVVDLGHSPVGGVVRDRLARAVGDPSLTVGYVLEEGGAPVDEHGRVLELPGPDDGRVVTPVELAGQPLALLVHDRAAQAAAPVLAGAASALGVAVANARLQAGVRARVAEVEASTQRLLDAADAERRRLGADLRTHVDPLLEQALAELRDAAADEALLQRLQDVREQLFGLAAGLDPALLAEHGLGAALRELAGQCGLPASVEVPPERFPAAIESCVWFTCAEAVANVLKHARATRLEIVVRREGEALHVEVRDDGVGGADTGAGSGLRRLADRVRAAGGELSVHSRPGQGTRVVADLGLGGSA